jgi:IS30 family transposase
MRRRRGERAKEKAGLLKAGRGEMWRPGRPFARRETRRRFWELIARGVAAGEAGRTVGISAHQGTRWYRQSGGMQPTNLAPLSGRYLSVKEREEIAIRRALGDGVRGIARRLSRAPSTISRELRRNAATGSYRADYRAVVAQWHADRRATRPKVGKLMANDRLRDYVQDRLGGKVAIEVGARSRGPAVRWKRRRPRRREDRRWATAWSPQQISSRLRVDFPDDATMRVSPETIYRALYVQGRGGLRRELTACLRTGRALRVSRARSRTDGRSSGFIGPEILISQRPAEAADRAVPGHWEGDLLVGKASSAIGTLVERTSRFTMLLHLPRMPGHGESSVRNGPPLTGHGAEAVRDAIAAAIAKLPRELWRSLTWDQGREMAQHARLRVETGLPIYFCDPHSPWQRGTNENTNGLLRQYFPKGTDLSRHDEDDLNAVACALNSRPRKTLGYRTPAEVLNDRLRSLKRARVATIP